MRIDVKGEHEEYLLLSGIQHIAFCERQWALIHIEQLWAENLKTVEGKHLHERVDDPFDSETRGDLYISRSVPLISHVLKIQGVADVIEYWRVESNGITLKNKTGLWQPRPVEYKRGKPKEKDCDLVQLCAQAMCLEEMLGVTINEGDLFYGQTRRRHHVIFDDAIRNRVLFYTKRMNHLFLEGITPPTPAGAQCKMCSLIDVCMPKVTLKKKFVEAYIDGYLKEIER